MDRDKLVDLRKWRQQRFRKPLIVKGARQVGKTWMVRKFGEDFKSFVEVNFERNPEYNEIFERGLNPGKIVSEISAAVGIRIVPGETLVFFDEVQDSPQALKSLRYFYEETPDLHIVAAGSLLGFAMEKVPIGVGRVSYLNLYPLSFGEFLEATGNRMLRDKILSSDLSQPFLDVHHNKLLDLVRQYMILGGMPAVVSAFIESRDFHQSREIQSDIILSLVDDFVKYAKEAEIPYLNKVFQSIPGELGKKFVFSHVEKEIRSYHFSKALDLLETAGLVYKIYHSKGDGIPLLARIDPTRFKVVLFDVGLLQRMSNVDLHHWMTSVNIVDAYKGAIAEQFVGQELASLTSAGKLSNLTYWHREKRGSTAEVDYLTELAGDIYPIEVKSATRGGMKSIRMFLEEKGRQRGIRISREPFGFDGHIRTVPFYAIERLFRKEIT